MATLQSLVTSAALAVALAERPLILVFLRHDRGKYFVGGADLPPDYTTAADIIHSDGFESGNTGRWSSTVG